MDDKTLAKLGQTATSVERRHAAMSEAIDKERSAHFELLERIAKLVKPALSAICQTPVERPSGDALLVYCVLKATRKGDPSLYLSSEGRWLESVAASRKLVYLSDDAESSGLQEVAAKYKARGVNEILRALAIELDRQLLGSASKVTDVALARASKVHAIITLLDD